MSQSTVTATARLVRKNCLTVPEAVSKASGGVRSEDLFMTELEGRADRARQNNPTLSKARTFADVVKSPMGRLLSGLMHGPARNLPFDELVKYYDDHDPGYLLEQVHTALGGHGLPTDSDVRRLTTDIDKRADVPRPRDRAKEDALTDLRRLVDARMLELQSSDDSVVRDEIMLRVVGTPEGRRAMQALLATAEPQPRTIAT